MDLPPEYVSLPVDRKQAYVQDLQSDVSELQATLDEIRSTAPTNLMSKMKNAYIPYPPVTKFKPNKSVKATLRHKVVEMCGFSQAGGFPSLATVAQNGTAVLWDATTGLKYESFHIGKGSTMSLAANKNGTVLAAGGLSCFLEVYCIGRKLRELTGCEEAEEVAAGNFDAYSSSMSGRAEQYRYSLSGHDAAVSAASFLDTTCVISGALDNSMFVWDVTRGSPLQGIYESSPITGIDTLNGSLFAGVTQGGALKVRDVRDRAGPAQVFSSVAPLSGVKFMPEGQSLLVSQRTNLLLYDMRTNGLLETYKFRGGSITSFDISSSGRLAAVGADTGALVAVDLFQNRWFPPIDKRKDRVSGVVIEGGTIFMSSWDGSVRSYYYAQ